MSLSKVTFNVNRDGLGRRIPNQDKVSGIVFYNNTKPAGWTVNDPVQLVYTLSEAEDKGLLENASGHTAEWYHVSEFFRANPEGEIYIGYFAIPAGTYDFAEVADLQLKAGGRCRQIGVFSLATWLIGASVTVLQGVLDSIDATGGRTVALLTENMSAVSDWSAEADLRALNAPKVSVVISQDGGGNGESIYTTLGSTVSSLGNALGILSLSAVQQSIGYVKQFNVSDGYELEIPALANGDLIKNQSAALLGGLKDKGYLILRKYTPQVSGTYYERQPGAVPATDDFAWIESSRTMDKAIRGVESVLIPELNRDLLLTDDGKLSQDVTGYFKDLCFVPLDQMQSDGEISASDVLIDPDQDIASTSTLTITIKIVPVGIAEFISVNIGFTVGL